MITEKERLKKQWLDFCRYIKDFAARDSNTNDEKYNNGRYSILHGWTIDLFNPDVQYYCMCNSLQDKIERILI